MRFATPFLASLLLPMAALAQPVSPLVAYDGVLNEARYGAALSTSAGGPAPGFGAGHELNALYVTATSDGIVLGIAGNVQNGNRILLFIDSKAGGVTGGNFDRANAPAGIVNFNSGTTFDAGFEPDYALVIGTDGTRSDFYFDLFTLTTTSGGGSSTFLGSANGSPTIGASPANGSTTQGFEIAIPAAALGYTGGNAQFFAAYTGESGFLSNQFLTPASSGQSNFGGNAVNFASEPPNPVTALATNLPVELSSFSAVADGDAAIVRWTTESETNNAGFSIETLRGAAWTEVAYAAGRGTTAERQSYQERVGGLAAGRHTFRLVQRDLDGTATIAGTVELVIGAGNALVAESRGRTVRFGAAVAQPLTVEAFDVLGRRVATLFAGTAEAGAVQSADLDGVAPGVYVVRVAGRTGVASTTLVVR